MRKQRTWLVLWRIPVTLKILGSVPMKTNLFYMLTFSSLAIPLAPNRSQPKFMLEKVLELHFAPAMPNNTITTFQAVFIFLKVD
jgi:hypothetical protein